MAAIKVCLLLNPHLLQLYLRLELKRGMVLRHWIAKLEMLRDRKATLVEHFVHGRIHPLGSHEYSMSRDQFQLMHQNFVFPIQLFPLFNEKMSELVCMLL
jgi:hypothetical protein